MLCLWYTPSIAPLTSPISWARGPCTGNYGTSQLHFLAPLLFALLATVPRKIFSPMSEQHHAGNWCCSRSMKLRMYCSLDTSCSIAWLLIVDWSITTCSILYVARLVLVAHHSFSLDTNKDLTLLCMRVPLKELSASCCYALTSIMWSN